MPGIESERKQKDVRWNGRSFFRHKESDGGQLVAKRWQVNEVRRIARSACAMRLVAAECTCKLLNPSMTLPRLKQQEIPFDDPDSNNTFRPSPEKPFVATPAAIELYSQEVIVACWATLREAAERHNGLDRLQVFEDAEKAEALWFIEDGTGGAITALLPSDY